MLDAIRSLLSGPGRQEPTKPRRESIPAGVDPVHVAACALLLDIAHADGEFSDAEQKHLEEVLGRHFGLSVEDGHRLLEIADAERQRAVDHFTFTSVLHRSYDLGQKMVLAEVIWGLVLADGEIAEHEHYLTRKISNLLELQPAYLATAKAAAAKKLGSVE
ncbi:MAG: TerB family tellurite resistance protein [Gemmatimonadaceae bacterium]